MRLEKAAAFDSTPTYRALQHVYKARFGAPLPLAELPDVELTSPKLKSRYTTARYARGVNAHFRECLARAAAPAP